MKKTFFILIMPAALWTQACGDLEEKNSEPDKVPADVQAIFTTYCAKSGCHAGTSPQQGMNLSEEVAYQNIVNVSSMESPSLKRANPGNANNSYLIHKIEGTQSVGNRMPLDQQGPDGGYLSSAQINAIRSWIDNGAQPR
ncbi:hypothetical protein HUU42_11020 [bacterium]|nr:hypothetical protein [bacterium]